MYLQPDAWKIGLSSVTMTGFPGIVLAGSACEERMLRYREGNASMLPAIPRIRTLEIAFHTLADTLLFICETIISCNEQDWGRNRPLPADQRRNLPLVLHRVVALGGVALCAILHVVVAHGLARLGLGRFRGLL